MPLWAYILLCALAALVSGALTPQVISWCRRKQTFDQPGERKVHQTAVPRLGGVALFAALAIGIALIYLAGQLSWLGVSPEQVQLLPVIFLGLLGFFTIGFMDDLKSLPALPRLLAQFGLAIVVVMLAGGQGLKITGVFGYALHPVLSVALSVLWIVGVVNTFNWIDGLDGLASGIAGISTLAFLALALLSPGTPNALLTVLLATVIIGAIMGFLPYNFNPAKIFIGDGGAFSLGYMLAVLSIVGLFKQAAAVAFFIPVLILALPIGDTAFAILRRLAAGKKITEADDKHIHHRMLGVISRGYRARLSEAEQEELDEEFIHNKSHRRAVLVLYSFAALFAVAAIVLGVQA